MGRLIDADAISFRCSYGGMCMGDIEDCRSCEYYVCNYEDIQNIPTVYDVEKVEAELEKNCHIKYEQDDDGCCFDAGKYVYLSDAIYMVKKGGVK